MTDRPTTPNAKRLFLGLSPPPSVRAIVADRARAALDGSIERVYAPEDLHLTLVFLGAVRPEPARAVADGLEAAFAGAAPVTLRIGGTGSFPGEGTVRVLWAGFDLSDRERAALEDLVARGRRLATAAGIELARADLERPFTPHLTLARPRAGERPAAELARLRFDLDWVADEVHLFESLGGGRTGRYPVRATVGLGRV